MDDLGFNKIAGAVLAVALGMLVLTKLPGIAMGSESDVIAYKVGSIEVSGDGEAPVDLPFPQADWVAAMDATAGAKVFKKCTACHNNEAGGTNGVGPNLYGIVDNDVASLSSFKYSAAMSAVPGNWTYEQLDDYLTKPSAHIPGNVMLFIGLKKPEDRAAVIEYLRVADSTPSPRPEAQPAVVEGAEEADVVIEASAEESGAEDAAPAETEPQETAPVEKTIETPAAEVEATGSGALEAISESAATESESVITGTEDKVMEIKDSVIDQATDMKDAAEEIAQPTMEDAAKEMEMPGADPTE